MYADEMNGYSIIASAIIDHTRGVIMGEGYRDNTLVYVVSELDHPDNAPDYWHNGTYFDGPDTLRNARDAHARFLTILSAGWDVEDERRQDMRRNATRRH